MIPAHKQTDLSKKPGQIVNPIPCGNCRCNGRAVQECLAAAKAERTLKDYIERKKESDSFFDRIPKKKSFEEYWIDLNIAYNNKLGNYEREIANYAWVAGQVNK